MSRPVDPDFIVRAMLVFPPFDLARKVETLRQAILALGTYENENFVGRTTNSQRIVEGADPGRDVSVTLSHPVLARQSDDYKGWIGISVMDDGPRKPTYVFLSINVGTHASQIDLQWRVGVALVPRLVTELRPDLGFMNGKRVEDERYDPLPTPVELRRSGLPGAVTPWTYISGQRADDNEVGKALQHLPVARSSKLADGHQLLVLERLQDSPPPTLLDALAELQMRYIPPQVPPQVASSEGNDDE